MAELCSFCQSITVADLRFVSFKHQPNLRALQISSSSCSFCNLLWHALVDTCAEKSIETHLQGRVHGREDDADTAIRLRGEFHDWVKPVPENGIQNSLIWIFSGRSYEEGLEHGTGVYGKLRLYARPDDACVNYFTGREIAPYPSCTMAISAMKTWVSRCQSHHSCGAGSDVNLPTRVIDLKPMDEGRNPLLFETAGQRGVYIALSYCWGDYQEFKITNSNYHEFRTNGIEHSKLAQTLKDAIQVTRLLGVRYIWIDAICIIQSIEGQSEIGNEDFNRECLRMQDYYGNSSLTILAGSASDCNHGFLEARRGGLQNALPSVPFEYTRHDGIKAGHIYAELYSSYQVGPLERRAWTLQEDILSPRLLIFGKDQMGYKCGMGEVWEDGTSNLAKWDGKGLFDISPRMILAVNTSITDGRARDRMLRQWYPMLQKYTRRQRSNPYDKLTAIAGIAQRAHQLIGGRYLFGLWETDIIRGLLWRSGWLPGDPDPPLPLNRVDAFKAPSWSWASTEGPIFCQYTTERQERTYLCSAKIRANFLSCCDGFDNHFDPIRGGVSLDSFRLRIRGTIKAVQCAVGTVLPLTDKRKRKTYYKCRDRMINLVPDELGNSCSTSPLGTIAVALTDTPIDHTEGYWCLRLITEEGLLLKHLKISEYKRVGVFLVSDIEWFDREKPEIIELL